jgi:hypothetical protein
MRNIIVIILVISSYLSFGQCSNFHHESCSLPINWPYEFDSQSMSAGIFPGQTFRIKTVLYEGNDYYLGFCKQDGIGAIQFKILINNIEIDNKLAIQENENHWYFELAIEKTMMAVFEIKLEKTQNVTYTPAELKCLAIIIGNKLTE